MRGVLDATVWSFIGLQEGCNAVRRCFLCIVNARVQYTPLNFISQTGFLLELHHWISDPAAHPGPPSLSVIAQPSLQPQLHSLLIL